MISERIAVKVENSKTGAPYPNGNMETAHAEIGAMQQAFKAGVTKGGDMTLEVTGRRICGYCKGDIPAMATKSGLKSLKALEVETGNEFFWYPGMKSLKLRPK